jgi:hypothetical protein
VSKGAGGSNRWGKRQFYIILKTQGILDSIIRRPKEILT